MTKMQRSDGNSAGQTNISKTQLNKLLDVILQRKKKPTHILFDRSLKNDSKFRDDKADHYPYNEIIIKSDSCATNKNRAMAMKDMGHLEST